MCTYSVAPSVLTAQPSVAETCGHRLAAPGFPDLDWLTSQVPLPTPAVLN